MPITESVGRELGDSGDVHHHFRAQIQAETLGLLHQGRGGHPPGSSQLTQDMPGWGWQRSRRGLGNDGRDLSPAGLGSLDAGGVEKVLLIQREWIGVGSCGR